MRIESLRVVDGQVVELGKHEQRKSRKITQKLGFAHFLRVQTPGGEEVRVALKRQSAFIVDEPRFREIFCLAQGLY
jgi:hypothetical protein